VRNAERVREAMRTAYLATPTSSTSAALAGAPLQAVTAFHDHHAQIRRTGRRTPAEARFERATERRLKNRALALLTA